MKIIKTITIVILSVITFNVSAYTCKDFANDLINNSILIDKKLEEAGEEAVEYIMENEADGLKIITNILSDELKTEKLGLHMYGHCIKNPDLSLSDVTYRSFISVGRE